MVPPPENRRELHTRNPTGRFSDRAEEYRKYRPSYAAEAIDAVLKGLGDPAQLVAADIGAGTGISVNLLADRGVWVFAVEPNKAMRDAATPHERVKWIDARAEATGLASGSVNLVLCAQAFHWFEPNAALAEFQRILVPRGRVALVWNDRDDADPMTAAYGRLIETASDRDPALVNHLHSSSFLSSDRFRNQRMEMSVNEQELDLDGLLGRAMSASYVPREGPKSAALLAGLRELHARFADASGLVRLKYLTRVYIGEAV